MPGPLAGRVDDATAERSRAYTLANGRFSLAQGAFLATLTLVALLSGILPALDGALAARGIDGAHRFVLFLVLLGLGFSVATLPFSVFHTFVLEERFGFNRTTPRLWLADRLKGLALEAAIGIPFLYATYGFMRFAGALWWVWLFGFFVAVQLVLLWLYPSVIAPSSTDSSRCRRAAARAARGARAGGGVRAPRALRDGRVAALGPLERLLHRDLPPAHRAVRHARRAHGRGRGGERARPRDRALSGPPRAPPARVSLAATLGVLFALSRLVPWPPLYAAFGFDGPSLHAALALLSLGGGAFVFWLAPFAAGLSRRHEYEADRYAVRLARAPEALETALVRLNGENLSNLHPHPWFSAWHYSHPVLVERLAAIQRVAAEERTAAAR